jgi:hypothetical protein
MEYGHLEELGLIVLEGALMITFSLNVKMMFRVYIIMYHIFMNFFAVTKIG